MTQIRRSRTRTLIVGWIRFVRLSTCVGAAFATFLGAHLAARAEIADWAAVAAAAVAMGMMMAVANMTNDVVDDELDRIEKADRPIPAGRISHRAARSAVVAAAAVGICTSAAVSPEVLAATSALLVPAIGYSFWVKGKVPLGSNLLVAVVSAAPVLVGGLAVRAASRSSVLAWSSILLLVVGYDVLKTASDVDGDRRGGMRTLATEYGPVAAIVVAHVATGLGLALVVVGALSAGAPLISVPLVAVVIVAPVLLLLRDLRTEPRRLVETLRRMWLLWFPCLAAMFVLR
jgi:geranylgeranylglycerol-phosphate geranylgeranyltransferase